MSSTHTMLKPRPIFPQTHVIVWFAKDQCQDLANWHSTLIDRQKHTTIFMDILCTQQMHQTICCSSAVSVLSNIHWSQYEDRPIKHAGKCSWLPLQEFLIQYLQKPQYKCAICKWCSTFLLAFLVNLPYLPKL